MLDKSRRDTAKLISGTITAAGEAAAFSDSATADHAGARVPKGYLA